MATVHPFAYPAASAAPMHAHPTSTAAAQPALASTLSAPAPPAAATSAPDPSSSMQGGDAPMQPVQQQVASQEQAAAGPSGEQGGVGASGAKVGEQGQGQPPVQDEQGQLARDKQSSKRGEEKKEPRKIRFSVGQKYQVRTVSLSSSRSFLRTIAADWFASTFAGPGRHRRGSVRRRVLGHPQGDRSARASSPFPSLQRLLVSH